MLAHKLVQFTYNNKLRVVRVEGYTDDFIEGEVYGEEDYYYADPKNRPYKRFKRSLIQHTKGFPGDKPSIKILGESNQCTKN